MNKTCENCRYAYCYPDGTLECQNPKPRWSSQTLECELFEPHKTLDEYIEEATKEWENVNADEYVKDVRGILRWHDAESGDLPPIDEEVIALDKRGKIAFAHRPNPKGWYGEHKTTGEVDYYYPKTYGNGGWNWDGVRWWMPCPKIPES